MSYNTAATFKLNAFPSGSFNNIPDNVIEKELERAAGYIDCALRVHHTLPMNTGSYSAELAPLYDMESAIVSYRLMKYRGFKPNITGTPDEVLSEAYAEVMDPEQGMIAMIRNGKMKFPNAADSTPNVSEGSPQIFGGSISTSQRQFNNNNEEYVS